MSMKNHIPDRRISFTRSIEVELSPMNYKSFDISIGIDTVGNPIEVFINGNFKSGTFLETMLDDVCILISKALQMGIDFEELRETICDVNDFNFHGEDENISPNPELDGKKLSPMARIFNCIDDCMREVHTAIEINYENESRAGD